MEERYRVEMKHYLNQMLETVSMTEKKYFLFGHCDATEEMLIYLRTTFPTLQILAILDNNESKWGLLCEGVRVKQPQSILHSCQEETVVLISSRAYEPMKLQLKEMGYKGEIKRVVDYNSFSEFSLEKDVILKKQERLSKGIDILSRVLKARGERYLVVCPYNAMGDAYLAMAYLPAFLTKYEGKKAYICVVGRSCAMIAKVFGADRVEVLDQSEMDTMVQAILYVKPRDCIISHHDRPYTNDMIDILKCRCITFEDFYRYGIYGLNKGVVPVSPWKVKEFSQKERIREGKSVIISPFSKSTIGLSDDFWRRTVSEYHEKGYVVFTNIAGVEHPLPDTESIEIPIEEMISAAEYAGEFFGIRSGLCDLLRTAKCKKTVVFPDAYYSSYPIKLVDFFGMVGWNQIIIET